MESSVSTPAQIQPYHSNHPPFFENLHFPVNTSTIQLFLRQISRFPGLADVAAECPLAHFRHLETESKPLYDVFHGRQDQTFLVVFVPPGPRTGTAPMDHSVSISDQEVEETRAVLSRDQVSEDEVIIA